MENAGARKTGQPSLRQEWALFFLAWLVIMPLVALMIPFATLHWWWCERRLRRYYKKANRLVSWDKSKRLLSSDNGRLMVEVHLLERAGRVWWLPGNPRDNYDEFPLAPASILQPSFGLRNGFDCSKMKPQGRGGTLIFSSSWKSSAWFSCRSECGGIGTRYWGCLTQ